MVVVGGGSCIVCGGVGTPGLHPLEVDAAIAAVTVAVRQKSAHQVFQVVFSPLFLGRPLIDYSLLCTCVLGRT